jgi:hypothetical protein
MMDEQGILKVFRARARQLVGGAGGPELETMLAAAYAWSQAATILEAKTYDPSNFGPAFPEALKKEEEGNPPCAH